MAVGGTLSVGQTPGFGVYETFVDFNLATAISNAATAVLSFARHADSWLSQHLIVEARTYDWGATVQTTDFVPGANLSGLPLLATYDTTGSGTDELQNFTSNGTALKDAVVAAGAGVLRVMLSSNRTRLATEPTTGEIIVFHDYAHATLRPRLTLTAA